CGRYLRDYITEMNMVREGQKRKTVAHLCHLEKRIGRDRANILEKDKPGAVVMGKAGREPLILGGLKSLAETMGFLEGAIRLFVEAMDVGFLEGT
ncbi:unnamed protein product, partial [Effrenium voratum]